MKIGRIIADLFSRFPPLEKTVAKLQKSFRKRRGIGPMARAKPAIAAAFSERLPIRRIALSGYLPSENASWPVPPISVAVIVPVYKGLEETQRCLKSLFDNTEDLAAKIYVIDDCSPEPRLSKWLEMLAAEGRITLLKNKTNAGFVASVNRGMLAAGSCDVVLLNSDTEVPRGWLGRLAGHAYSAANVGTVTPFSNNATICSWPTIRDSDLPAGRTVGEIDAAFRVANRGRQVELPTAVGFCMYLRRKCIEEIGSFDEKSFGRGYGEENDFCLRAQAGGWKHLLACDTFVFHTGETSFGKNSPERLSAWATLCRLYPDYPRAVAHHVEADEAGPFRFAATAMLFKQSIEPTILLVSHALGGGTERHIQDLIKSVGSQVNFLRLEPVSSGVKVSIVGLVGHPVVVFGVEQSESLSLLLQSFGIDRIHIHHWLGFEGNLRWIVDTIGVPFDLTIHDYFSICPQINLLANPDSAYCGEPGAAGCNVCIVARPRFGATDITEWRTRHSWLLNEAQRVICPSEDTGQRMAKYFPHAAIVTVHHESVVQSSWHVPLPLLMPGERLRVGLIGVVAKHKGLDALSLALQACNSAEYEFKVIGFCEPPLPSQLRDRVHETGRYPEVDLARLLKEANLHVAWFPAKWPETYSYTLTAAIDTEIPIVASSLGAFAERLVSRPLTWISEPHKDGQEWRKVFETVRQTLIDGTVAISGQRPVSPAPFYPNLYLEPVLEQRSMSVVSRCGRSIQQSTVLVMPDRYANGSISPCGYIRLLQPLDLIASQSSDFMMTVIDLASALKRTADCLVCQRHAVATVEEADRLINHCRQSGIRLIYDLDDDLITIPSDHPEVARLTSLSAAVFRLLMAADGVWLSTPELKRRYLALRPDAIVVPNSLDDRLWNGAHLTPKRSGDTVRCLYMGTATHDEELAFLRPIAEQLKQRYARQLSFDIVGVSHGKLQSAVFRRVAPTAGSVTEAYPGFVEWFGRQSWDIGLAPLLDTPFNRCKSAIKLMDYAAIGLPVVASEQAEYRRAFGDSDGVRFVPNTVEAWVESLSQLIDSEALRRKEGARAHENFCKHHALSRHVEMRRDAIMQVLYQPPRSAHVPILQLESVTDDQTTAVPRELIAAAYLSGDGIEIGALHNPLKIPPHAKALYVDRLNKAGLYEHYPELKKFNLVEVDIIDNGEQLSTVQNDSQDFVIANHFLEHCQDPLATLENLMRVVRPGGMIYMAVPDKRRTFDRDRQITPLEHLIQDHLKGPEGSRRQHYREWVTEVEPHFGRFGSHTPADVIDRRIDELMEHSYSIHFHCWTSHETLEMLLYARDAMQLPFDIKFFGEYEANHENIFIVRKKGIIRACQSGSLGHKVVGSASQTIDTQDSTQKEEQVVQTAISKIGDRDAVETNSRYGLWKYTIPLPPESLMWSIGGQNVENFLVVADAWAQVVSRYTKANCRLLDIGSGCGRTARILVNNHFIRHYVGFDVILANVQWCQKYIQPAFQERNCEFHHFDIYSKEYNPQGAIQGKDFTFPCKDASIDVVFAASLFTHLLEADARRYLAEIARVMCSAGTAIVSIHVAVASGVNYQGSEVRIDVDKQYFIDMAGEAGLKCLDTIDDLAGQTVLILSRTVEL